ncbi:MAG: protease HtpX [Candidatus Dasytiphilus stammeri]
MRRLALFIITNISVMLIIGVLLTITGIKSSSVLALMVLAGVTGFGGALISLFLSKKIALMSVGGKIITKPCDEIQQWLIETISKQAKKMRIGMPKVAIYPATDINAFATGARRDDSLIAVSAGLLKDMTKEEVEAVLAHEMSHIANGDMVTMTLLQGIANTFVFFISRILAQFISGLLSANRNYNSTSTLYFVTAAVSALQTAIGILSSIIIMWFSRKREFYADAGAARLVGRDKMIAALQRLKSSIELPKEISTIRPFCINGNGSKKRKRTAAVSMLFNSHPSLEQRIKALRTLKYLK